MVGIAPRLSDAELVTLAVIQSPAEIHFRGPFLALRACPSQTMVPVSAYPIRLQQAATPLCPHDATRHRLAGPGLPVVA